MDTPSLQLSELILSLAGPTRRLPVQAYCWKAKLPVVSLPPTSAYVLFLLPRRLMVFQLPCRWPSGVSDAPPMNRQPLLAGEGSSLCG